MPYEVVSFRSCDVDPATRREILARYLAYDRARVQRARASRTLFIAALIVWFAALTLTWSWQTALAVGAAPGVSVAFSVSAEARARARLARVLGVPLATSGHDTPHV
jgi:fatty acid desaturase